MKPIIRNLVSVIRRFKLAAALNILGLSVAFAAFMVIMIQVEHDYGFDRFHKDYDKIFRVEANWRQSSEWSVYISRPHAERFFESSPHIVAGAIAQSNEGNHFFWVENDGVRNLYRENGLVVTPGFFDVFTFDFVEGSVEEQIAPGSIIIPLSMSRKYFENEPAVGKQLNHNGWGPQTVRAVYRDFPLNSIVNNVIYFAMQPHENRESWQNHNYNTYIRVNQASNAPMLFDNFKRTFDGALVWGEDFDWDAPEALKMRLTPLPEIYYATDTMYDNAPKGSKQLMSILFAIAIVIIAIAGINFTNFTTALTPMRIKNINTQRVLGAFQSTIRLSIIAEAVFFSLLSYIIALLLVLQFKNTSLVELINADLTFSAKPIIVGGTAIVAFLVGIFAGAYPSLYMTSFEPAMVLKGSFGLSPKGKKIRNTLIGIQFVASFALIIGALFMYLQNHFMLNSPLGFDRDELIVVNVGMRDDFTRKLMEFPGVEEITFGDNLLSGSDRYMGWGRPYKGGMINFHVLPVHYTFLNVTGIAVSEGRDFRWEDVGSNHGAFIFNQAAKQKYDLELGATISAARGDAEIIGFIPDVKFASFRLAVEPMAFYVWGTENWGNHPQCYYIRLNAGADKRAVMSHVKATLVELYPDFHPFLEALFYDEVLQSLYETEKSLSSLITLFSMLAIFISIVGVFGLVVFDSECRRKEIGIRKVHGASTLGIVMMFNKAYFKILAVCFILAAPLAWYAVTRWLENFAYKTPMYWWVYLLAFAAVASITVCTVTFQNWKVANDDPVKSIKSE